VAILVFGAFLMYRKRYHTFCGSQYINCSHLILFTNMLLVQIPAVRRERAVIDSNAQAQLSLIGLWAIEAESARSGQLESRSASLHVASAVSRLATTRQKAVTAVMFYSLTRRLLTLAETCATLPLLPALVAVRVGVHALRLIRRGLYTFLTSNR
jgi:hypothetical protein